MARTITTYTGNGFTTLYPVDFPLGYINKDHVYVYLEGSDYTDQLSYTWQNDTEIEFAVPPAPNVRFSIRRVVPRSALVNDYTDGAILRESNLDDSFKQALMALEEVADGFATTDDTFTLNTDLDMLGNKIQNLADAVLDNDAVSYLFLREHLLNGEYVKEQDLPDFILSAENFILTTNNENVELISGQTVVTLSEITTVQASVYVSGPNVDTSRLVKTIGFTVDSDTQITLAESYPAGTILSVWQNEGAEAAVSDIQTSDNITTLKAKALVPTDTAVCARYTAGGDLVSGLKYYIKTVAQAAADNDIADGYINHTLINGHIAVLQVSNGVLNLDTIGAKGDGVTDNTAIFEAANASKFKHHRLVSGTYLTDYYIINSDSCLEGTAGDRPTLKLNDGANSILIYGEDTSNVTIRDIVVDGNRANQSIGAGNNNRGIYFLGQCHNISIDNVTIKNATDHGLFFSSGNTPEDECGKDSIIHNVIVTNCGSQTHIDTGGAGGTGIVGGQRSTHFTSCVAYGNHLNGFKSNGTHTGCESYNNTGGGYETGFGSPSTTQAKWVQCSAEGNGGSGWRNQGEGDELTWIGCVAKRNGYSGIILLNEVNRATIDGCWFIENGQESGTESRSDTDGFDGITITGTSAAPNDIIINNCQFHDDQGTKTQEIHIYVRKTSDNISIADNNIFGSSKLQPLYVEVQAASSNIKVGKSFGLTTYVNDVTTETLTGTTSVTTLTDHVIEPNSLLSSTRLRLTVVGDTSGTNGTKDIRIQVAGEARTLATIATPDEVAYYIEAEIVRHVSSAYVQYKCFVEGQATQEGLFKAATSFSSSMIVRTIGQLSNSLDSITQQRFTLEQV